MAAFWRPIFILVPEGSLKPTLFRQKNQQKHAIMKTDGIDRAGLNILQIQLDS